MLIHTVFWGGIFSIIGNWEYYMSYSKTPLVYSAEKSRRVENRSTQKNIRDIMASSKMRCHEVSYKLFLIVFSQINNFILSPSIRFCFLPDWSWNFVIGQTMLWTAQISHKKFACDPRIFFITLLKSLVIICNFSKMLLGI